MHWISKILYPEKWNRSSQLFDLFFHAFRLAVCMSRRIYF
uniref:Uncharacterized protein n=1 Tax=Rhizophora mucronata TaxID=61149 RepID=A0A2P2NW70_RHIMU